MSFSWNNLINKYRKFMSRMSLKGFEFQMLTKLIKIIIFFYVYLYTFANYSIVGNLYIFYIEQKEIIDYYILYLVVVIKVYYVHNT